ncbi:MAG: PDZ domain-containing protein [Thermoanaerobaculia bacterium]|nr:PDZ domain-containing protein [Thermoanaerobaculia bacterium]
MMRHLQLRAWIAGAALLLATFPATGQEAKRCDQDALVCVKAMAEAFENRGWIGLEMDYSDRDRPRILKVIPGSPAEEAGIQPGDVLLSFAGVDYATASEEELRRAKEKLLPGNDIVLGVLRGESELDLTVHARTIPEGVLAQWIGSHLLIAHKDEIAAAETP